MSLLEKTKKVAKERRLSLTDVATKAGIAQKSIYQWGTVTPKADTLKSVANVLGVSTDYLLDNTDEKNISNNNETNKDEMNLDEALEDRGMVMKYQGKEISDKAKKAVLSVLDLLDEED